MFCSLYCFFFFYTYIPNDFLIHGCNCSFTHEDEKGIPYFVIIIHKKQNKKQKHPLPLKKMVGHN